MGATTETTKKIRPIKQDNKQQFQVNGATKEYKKPPTGLLMVGGRYCREMEEEGRG